MRTRSKPDHHCGIALMLATLGCALAIAACGSSGTSTNGSGSGASSGRYGPAGSPAAMSRCMRANGVPGFPDPIAGEGLPFTVNSDGSLTAEGQTFAGPALRSAERVCEAYLPPAGPPPRISAGQQRRALAFARCMRANGVPNFPDPVSTQADETPVPGVSSPAFQKANNVCFKTAGGSLVVPP